MAVRRAVTCNSARAHKIMKTRYNGDKIFMQFFFFFKRNVCSGIDVRGPVKVPW